MITNKKEQELAARTAKFIENHGDEYKSLVKKRTLQALINEAPFHADVCTVLAKFDEPGKSLEEIIAAALSKFRDDCIRGGYALIEKDSVPVVRYFGTIEDKAAIILHLSFDAERNGKRSKISKGDIKKIRESVSELGHDAKAEFTRVLERYDVLAKVCPKVDAFRYAFLEGLNGVDTELTNYDWLCFMKQHLQEICDTLPEETLEELVPSFDNAKNFMKKMVNSKDSVKNIDRNWVQAKSEEILKGVKEYSEEFLLSRYVAWYSIVSGVQDWIKENHAQMFIPTSMRLEMLFLREAVHTMDKHRLSSEITVLDKQGREESIIPKERDIKIHEGFYNWIKKELNETAVK